MHSLLYTSIVHINALYLYATILLTMIGGLIIQHVFYGITYQLMLAFSPSSQLVNRFKATNVVERYNYKE